MQNDKIRVSRTASDWWLYLIRTHAGHLYCGVTTEVSRRLQEHQSGGAKCAKFLKGKGPLTLVFTHQMPSKRQAMQWEWQIKRWPKARKEALILGKESLVGANCAQ